MIQKTKEKNMLKSRSKRIVLPIAALILIAGTAFAQPPGMHEGQAGREGMHGYRMSERASMIPDLSEEQQIQMRTLRVKHVETMQSLRNQMAEKKARLRTITTTDKVNMSDVNKVIDDIGAMQTQMMKLREQHRQEIRKLLNDEQRVFFDAHRPGHDGSHHKVRHQGKETR